MGSVIFYNFLSQRAHWSIRCFLGSQMLILARNWSTLWRPVEKLIFPIFWFFNFLLFGSSKTHGFFSLFTSRIVKNTLVFSLFTFRIVKNTLGFSLFTFRIVKNTLVFSLFAFRII